MLAGYRRGTVGTLQLMSPRSLGADPGSPRGWAGSPDDPLVNGRLGHCRCRSRQLVPQVIEPFDARVLHFAEVIPHTGLGRNDVGLIASVRDHIVRTMFRPQMLPPEVPGMIHQFDGVERAAAFPGGHRRVSRLSVEEILHRYHADIGGAI